MLPLFGDEKRRKINLGGSSSVSTLSAITDQAKARRIERTEQKRKNDSAIRIQAWWRAVAAIRAVKTNMRRLFEEDIEGLRGLRCIVLIGLDQGILGKWSQTILAKGEGTQGWLEACSFDGALQVLFSLRRLGHSSQVGWFSFGRYSCCYSVQ